MKVLGIETSCDDTSIAIIEYTNDSKAKILAHQSFSQEFILQKWGGVVPEIAARNHLEKIAPLLDSSFQKASLTPSDLDLIGVTTHPGLLGPLLTGINAAKTIAMLHEKPIVAINHLHAHLEAIFLATEINYPYLGMLVSGGNSQFFLVTASNNFQLLGGTIDDAAGEAFDKGAKLMGLGYPGGRIIDTLAQAGDRSKYKFPIGLQHSKEINLSFSGVKTALRLFLEKNPSFVFSGDPNNIEPSHISQDIKDLAASYQESIIEALKLKLKIACDKITDWRQLPIVVGGGVACNGRLRSVLSKNFSNVHFVPPAFCTDNGAMIANYAYRIRQHALPMPTCLELDAGDGANQESSP
ncbi:MAG TPA: tRNA (adenosine(37)-N6)-threonylcarbamoyltransferase complex transferase subunit TsaD [Bacteriovoracaceae bacterium]|nr:tRNA (adenosine(37)-N6)-threonylcarbamoyltransferase complex transferase subunit TsaD [Bacteriovoracaceae bacterium]